MMCELCHKNVATEKIHISFLGEMKEFEVCDSCAEKHGLDNPFAGLPDALGFLLLGFIAQSLTHAQSEDDALRCKQCDMTFSEFRETGTFGCAECYDSFHAVIETMIRRIHGSTKHIGNRPATMRRAHPKSYNLEELQRRLQAAVANEDYEEAAKLRDIIQDLEAAHRAGHE